MSIVMVRTVVLYIVIAFSLRIMGKRQLGELQPSELAVTILISNIATLPIEDTNIPLMSGLIPILTLMSFEVLVSYFVLKNKRLRSLIVGNPVVVIRDGNLNQSVLRELRLNLDDLMTQLRLQGVFDIRDVSVAILETTGMLSVYRKFGAQPVTAAMMNLPDNPAQEFPPMTVINDGIVLDEALVMCNLRREWLDKTLEEQQTRAEDVFLMVCDRQANFTIIPRVQVSRKNGGGGR